MITVCTEIRDTTVRCVEATANGYRVILGSDEKVLKLDCNNSCTKLKLCATPLNCLFKWVNFFGMWVTYQTCFEKHDIQSMLENFWIKTSNPNISLQAFIEYDRTGALIDLRNVS